jgi:hypothetical protein
MSNLRSNVLEGELQDEGERRLGKANGRVIGDHAGPVGDDGDISRAPPSFEPDIDGLAGA